MKKILITMIISVFFISMVSAVDFYGQQYQDIQLYDVCDVNGFPCDTSYVCNLTIKDPDGHLILLNEPMYRNDTIYNYTFEDTNALGLYEMNTFCTNTTFSGTYKYTFEITTTGRQTNLMMILGGLFAALILFIISLVIKNRPVGFISGLLFSMSGIYIMIYGFGNVADLYTQAIAYSTIGLGGMIILVAGVGWMQDVD